MPDRVGVGQRQVWSWYMAGFKTRSPTSGLPLRDFRLQVALCGTVGPQALPILWSHMSHGQTSFTKPSRPFIKIPIYSLWNRRIMSFDHGSYDTTLVGLQACMIQGRSTWMLEGTE